MYIGTRSAKDLVEPPSADARLEPLLPSHGFGPRCKSLLVDEAPRALVASRVFPCAVGGIVVLGQASG